MKLKMDDFADGDWVPKTIRLCHPPHPEQHMHYPTSCSTQPILNAAL